MRRGVGVGRALKAQKEKAAFQEKGAELSKAKFEDMRDQLKVFKEKLEEFALKHKKKINKDPEFRSKFQNMCAKVGVDPLASNKGFWAEVLGVGSFYFELAVQTVHVCLATRESNGGLISLTDLVQYLQRVRPKGSEQGVSEDDVKRAVDTLEPLGNGIRLVQVGAQKMVVSVPMELSSDLTEVIRLGQESGGMVTSAMIEAKYRWNSDRAKRAIESLLMQGMLWEDAVEPHNKKYWFPSMTLNLM